MDELASSWSSSEDDDKDTEEAHAEDPVKLFFAEVGTNIGGGVGAKPTGAMLGDAAGRYTDKTATVDQSLQVQLEMIAALQALMQTLHAKTAVGNADLPEDMEIRRPVGRQSAFALS